MTTQPSNDERLEVVGSEPEETRAAFAEDVRAGLLASPRRLPCRYFYDGEGSRLFEEICKQPEYYPPRAETGILAARAASVAAAMEEDALLAELGSGSARKTRLLIEAFLERGGPLHFVPVDISRTALMQSSEELLRDYSRLSITAVLGEYAQGLEWLEAHRSRQKLVAWLGSNVGNLGRREAAAFLRSVRAGMNSRDRLLLGVDLRKDRKRLERAYDDAAGVTARFNKNLLARINRELGGRFPLDVFEHRATWEEDPGRVVMSLVSRQACRVRIDVLDLEVAFAAGEPIHTEDCYKYSLEEIERLSREADLVLLEHWLDVEGQFSLNLLRPA